MKIGNYHLNPHAIVGVWVSPDKSKAIIHIVQSDPIWIGLYEEDGEGAMADLLRFVEWEEKNSWKHPPCYHTSAANVEPETMRSKP